MEPFEGAANRHLHVFTKTGPTPEGFPRRPGMARKRPLKYGCRGESAGVGSARAANRRLTLPQKDSAVRPRTKR